MRKDLYKELFDLEDDYWWHVGKREIVKFQISCLKFQTGTQAIKILDVGCGAGRWLQELGKIFPKSEIWGVDKEPKAIEFCQKRNLKNLKIGTAEKLPFDDFSFDLVTCLDLLEHVSGDQKAISEFYRILKPGGFLILSVPAYKKLFCYWDKMLLHQRRYDRQGIERLLEKEDLRVFRLTFANFFVFFPSLLIRFFKSKSKKGQTVSDFMPVPCWLNRFLIFIYKAEALLLTKLNFPFGLSILAVAKK